MKIDGAPTAAPFSSTGVGSGAGPAPNCRSLVKSYSGLCVRTFHTYATSDLLGISRCLLERNLSGILNHTLNSTTLPTHGYCESQKYERFTPCVLVDRGDFSGCILWVVERTIR